MWQVGVLQQGIVFVVGELVVGEDYFVDGWNNIVQQYEEGDQYFVYFVNGQYNVYFGGGEGQCLVMFVVQQMVGGGGDVIDGGVLDGQQVEIEYDYCGY